MSLDQGVWLERLEVEYDNLRAALEWSQEEAQWSTVGLRLAAAFWRFWLVHGHLREGSRWLEAVLAGSRGALPAVQAKALYGPGRQTFLEECGWSKPPVPGGPRVAHGA